MARLKARLPPPLRRWADRFDNAPLTHIVAFLALHEFTAVAPLLGLVALFHYRVPGLGDVPEVGEREAAGRRGVAWLMARL